MVLTPKNSKLKNLVVAEAVKDGGKFTSWKCTIISHHFIVSHLSSSLSFPQLIALTISNPMVDVSGQGDVVKINNVRVVVIGCLVKVVLAGRGGKLEIEMHMI